MDNFPKSVFVSIHSKIVRKCLSSHQYVKQGFKSRFQLCVHVEGIDGNTDVCSACTVFHYFNSNTQCLVNQQTFAFPFLTKVHVHLICVHCHGDAMLSKCSREILTSETLLLKEAILGASGRNVEKKYSMKAHLRV